MERTIQPSLRITPRDDNFLDRKVGSRGEIFYDQNSNSLRVYDGKRQGGFELARTDLANVPNASLLAKSTVAGLATETFVTTAISNIPEVDLTGYATETFVTTAIGNIPEVDLTGYATETFVTTAIGNIPEVDLTGLASEDYVDTAISNIPEVDLSGLASEDYVDTAISNIEIPEVDLSSYAPLNNPTFTGTVGGITSTMVGLGNVTNESKATMFTSPSFTGTTTLQQTIEVLDTKTGATGTVVHDFSTGAIWYHSGISANFTANFTNVPTTNNRAISIALILIQGATPYIPNVVQIDGTPITINWQDNETPTGNANKRDLVSFTLLRVSSAWSVIGSLSTYG